MEASWKVVQQATSKKGQVSLTLGSHFGPFLDPWGHLGSIMGLSELKKCHLGKIFLVGPDFGLSFGLSQMCSGGFSLQSQLDFQVFSMSQNGSKMDPKM